MFQATYQTPETHLLKLYSDTYRFSGVYRIQEDIPVMFLTSNNDRESIISVMSLNPVNYLLKTLPRSEIYGKIKAFFEQ